MLLRVHIRILKTLRHESQYGKITAARVSAIGRKLLQLAREGDESLFGDPMLNLDNLLTTDEQGYGTIDPDSRHSISHATDVYKKQNSGRPTRQQGVVETLASSTARAMGNELGRPILRGVLGSIFGRRRR